MKQRKILHLAKYYKPDRGGIEAVTSQIVDGLYNKYDFTVLAFAKGKKKYPELKLPYKLIRCKSFITVSSQPISISYLLKGIVLANNSDIIHLHFPNIVALMVVLFSNNKNVTIHWHSDVFNKGLFEKFVGPLIKLTLKKARYVVPTTDVYADSSVYLKNYTGSLIPIPIGIDDFYKHNSPISDKLIYNQYPFLQNKKIVLAIGRLVGFKGFDCVVEFARKFDSSWIFFIAGAGPEKNSLKSLVDKYNLAGRVFISDAVGPLEFNSGNISSQVLDWLLRNSKFLLFPSIHRAESFGIVQVEALCYSLPILSFNIEGSGTGFVSINGLTGCKSELYNLQPWYEFVLKCDSDVDYFLSIKKNCRARYLDKFQIQKQIDSFDNLYMN